LWYEILGKGFAFHFNAGIWLTGLADDDRPDFVFFSSVHQKPKKRGVVVEGKGVRRETEVAAIYMGRMIEFDDEFNGKNRVDPIWVRGAFDCLADECRRRLQNLGIILPDGPKGSEDISDDHNPNFEPIIDIIKEVLFAPRGPTEGEPLNAAVPQVRCPILEGYGLGLEADLTDDDPARNNCLDQILLQRTGCRLPLAIIYCAIARRLGIHANVADTQGGTAYVLAVNKKKASEDGEENTNPYNFVCLDVLTGAERVSLTVLQEDPPTENATLNEVENFVKYRYMQPHDIFMGLATKFQGSLVFGELGFNLTESSWRVQELNDRLSGGSRFRIYEFLAAVHPEVLSPRQEQRAWHMKHLKPEYLPFRDFDGTAVDLPSSMKYSIGSIVKRTGTTDQPQLFGVVIDCIHAVIDDKVDEEKDEEHRSSDEDAPEERESNDSMFEFVRGAIERDFRLFDVEDSLTAFAEQEFIGVPLPRKEATFSILLSPQGNIQKKNLVAFHSRGVAIVDQRTLQATSLSEIFTESDDKEKTRRDLEFLDFECGRYFLSVNDDMTCYLPNALTRAKFGLE
jgi:Transglutaminase-like superfamily